MHRNSATDSATRTASARIMVGFLGRPSASRPRIIATPAKARAPRIATNATAMRIFMRTHYGDAGRRLVVLLGTLAGVALTARLGAWQLDRAHQKITLERSLDERAALPPLPQAELATTTRAAAAQHHRRVRLQGRWLPRFTVYLDNRQMEGWPGFYVVTPMQLSGSDQTVVVQRGWLPRDLADRTRIPAVPTPDGEVTIEGRIAPPPARLYELSTAASGSIRQHVDFAA